MTATYQFIEVTPILFRARPLRALEGAWEDDGLAREGCHRRKSISVDAFQPGNHQVYLVYSRRRQAGGLAG